MIEIQVEDEPLLIQAANQIEMNGQRYIQLITDHDDEVIVDQEHAIFMRDYQGQARPYVHVRFGVNALIGRAAFLHLVEMGELLENSEGATILQLQSGDLSLQLQSWGLSLSDYFSHSIGYEHPLSSKPFNWPYA